ncbi:MAG TPA: S41 family peptidase [Bryobacteraceae bacterium]|nr:S41 family peptidase [Bryobacteraceae bacterium]
MRLLSGICLFAISLHAQVAGLNATTGSKLTPQQRQLNLDSFEKVWTAVRDHHWEKNPGGLDWQAIHTEFRPRIEQADSMDAARTVMRDMLERLHQTHFGIIPSTVYDDVDVAAGEGSPGVDLRVIDTQAIVTHVDSGSPAEKAGVTPGWAIVSVDGKELAPVIQKLQADPAMHELTLERSVLARLSGPVGGKLPVVFSNGANRKVALDLSLTEPRGQAAKFGNLPTQHVWFESKKIENTEYVAFNMFLDLPRIMGNFGDAVNSCLQCSGLIIDLRGNPGGIGGMAMGMAGFLVDKPDQKLGTMYMRDATIKFAVLPRPQVFNGPVAVLMDGSSASTSEIFAGGLKDLGRARIFGTRSAAAALPSIIEKLPNGDGFQYAMANYISDGGKPLEGNGVVPDVEVKLTRQALLDGHDPVVDAALQWIKKQREQK